VLGAAAFPLYASLQRDAARTREVLRALLTALSFVLFPVYLLMIALAPALAEALGARWEGTAPLIQIVGAGSLLGLYADAVMPLLSGRGRPDRSMLVVTAQTTALLLLLFPLVATWGVLGAAVAWLPAFVAAQAVSVVFVRRTLGSSMAGAGAQLLGLLAIWTVAAAAGASVRIWLSGAAAVAGGLVVGLVVGAILLVPLRHRLQLGLSVWLHPADTEREGPTVVNGRPFERSSSVVEGSHDARA
jgi:lipopolysaccharide exporter